MKHPSLCEESGSYEGEKKKKKQRVKKKREKESRKLLLSNLLSLKACPNIFAP